MQAYGQCKLDIYIEINALWCTKMCGHFVTFLLSEHEGLHWYKWGNRLNQRAKKLVDDLLWLWFKVICRDKTYLQIKCIMENLQLMNTFCVPSKWPIWQECFMANITLVLVILSLVDLLMLCQARHNGKLFPALVASKLTSFYVGHCWNSSGQHWLQHLANIPWRF